MVRRSSASRIATSTAAPDAAEPALQDPQAEAPQGPASSPTDAARGAGRGGLAISGAKVWFILAGFVQQTLLPRIIGLDGYGAYSVVQSLANIPNNVVTTTSIQGVSRTVAGAAPRDEPTVARRALGFHALLAPLLALTFALAAPLLARFEHAPHIVGPLRVFAFTLFVYALYTPLVGILNGRRRFLSQAALDVTFATLRTAGLLGGAYVGVRWFARASEASGEGSSFAGPTGAAVGIAIAAAAILPLAAAAAGLTRSAQGASGAAPASVPSSRAATVPSAPAPLSFRTHLGVLAPIALGQLALNVLMQADLTLLARFAHHAGEREGLSGAALRTGTDALVGAYRAAQLFAFLPAQLLISITFILFPMVARARAEEDARAVADLVRGGFRLALVLTALMVSCTAGLGPELLRLAFPPEAAARAGDALRVLAVGQGAFAVFSLEATVLVSLGREKASAVLTALAAASVGVLCAVLVPSRPFGPGLLIATATATSLALAGAATVGAFLVVRAAGAFTSATTLVRSVGCMAVCIFVASHAPWLGKAAVLVEATAVALLFVLLAAASGELTRKDASLVSRVLSRAPRK